MFLSLVENINYFTSAKAFEYLKYHDIYRITGKFITDIFDPSLQKALMKQKQGVMETLREKLFRQH